MSLRILVCFLAASVLATGCSDLGDPVAPPEAPPAVSFAADVQPIFTAGCVGCHGEGGNGGLDLRAGQSLANLVGVVSPSYGAARVIPGDPTNSVMYVKLTGGVGFGQAMPPTGTSLPTAALETIRRWIADGAPDN